MAGDDAVYSFRSVGMVDYVASTNMQSTPVTWFPEAKWWQALSFHDHPPLIFIIQKIFFSIGGINIWSARIPFLIAGMFSVFLGYLVAKLLFGEIAGLFSALFLAVSNYAIWASRTGYIDGFLMLWILLSIYFFLKAERRPINYIWWGLFLGLGALTKYTFLFILPLFGAMLLWRKKDFWQKYFYFGAILFFFLISPIVIYNIMMRIDRGHFDASISTIIGESPKDFKVLQRETNKNINIFAAAKYALAKNSSYGFQIAILVSLIVFIYEMRRKALRKKGLFVAGGLILAMAAFSLVGGEKRFGVILLPFLALIFGFGVSWVFESRNVIKYAGISVFSLILFFEFAFSARSQLFEEKGAYNRLEDYLLEFYENNPGRPNANLYADSSQLSLMQIKIIEKAQKRNPSMPVQKYLLIYDDHLAWFPSIWLFERRRLYEATPIHTLSMLISALSAQGPEFYTSLGIKEVVLVTPVGDIPQNNIVQNKEGIKQFISQMEAQIKPVDEIKDSKGKVLFKIYQFPLI